MHSLRWTGGKGANDLQSYQGGGFNSTTGNNMREEMKLEKNWMTVLHNYSLMMDTHSETDAQNWHIIGIDLVSSPC